MKTVHNIVSLILFLGGKMCFTFACTELLIKVIYTILIFENHDKIMFSQLDDIESFGV